jgi:hypothetical protein
MVAIPQHNDPTLQAMKVACEAQGNKQAARNYLGASLIGNPCSRQIWYSYKAYPKKPFSAETLWNFEDGHRTEDLIAARLRLLPNIELWTHDEQGNQFGFEALGGKFKGHIDGVIRGLIQAPKALHIWENKCSAEKKYNEFQSLKAKHGEKQTLKNWNEGYFIQAQLYMHFLNIDRHYTTVAKAGGRDIDSCRTEYQPEIAEKAIDKADKIISAVSEPVRISEAPDYFICRWCDYADICRK